LLKFVSPSSHWYYEDFIREENPKLPSLPLKKFSAMLFNACPLKTRVPVCGAIMLNDKWDKVLPYLFCFPTSTLILTLCSVFLSRAGSLHPDGGSGVSR